MQVRYVTDKGSASFIDVGPKLSRRRMLHALRDSSLEFPMYLRSRMDVNSVARVQRVGGEANHFNAKQAPFSDPTPKEYAIVIRADICTREN